VGLSFLAMMLGNEERLPRKLGIRVGE